MFQEPQPAEVVQGERRGGEGGGEGGGVPLSRHELIIENSDGVTASHPPPKSLNFRRVPLDHPRCVTWLSKLSNFPATLAGDPHFPSSDPRNARVGSFPAGYALFQNSRRRDGKFRRSGFELFGNPRGRFRRPADFRPHLIWLACGGEASGRSCSCLVCDRKHRRGTGVEGEENALGAGESVVEGGASLGKLGRRRMGRWTGPGWLGSRARGRG